MTRTAITLGASALIGLATLAHADEQAAIDGCIDQIRTVTGGLGGEVLQSSFSEAGTNVTLRDSDGTVWECIGYSDGTVGDLRVNEEAGADDGGGAMAGASQTGDVQVRFGAGDNRRNLQQFPRHRGRGPVPARRPAGSAADRRTARQQPAAELHRLRARRGHPVRVLPRRLFVHRRVSRQTASMPSRSSTTETQGTTGSFDMVFEIN
jgi:hypothetical protein